MIMRFRQFLVQTGSRFASLLTTSATSKIPKREPMLECKREPDDEYVKRDKQKVKDEVTARYGEITAANLIKHIRESHAARLTMRFTVDNTSQEYPQQYTAMEEMEAHVWYGLAVLAEQFPADAEAASFMIQLFRSVPENSKAFYFNQTRFKIAVELGNMSDAHATEMLLGILVNDFDVYSVRSIAAKKLTCQRSTLPPEKRELLFTALMGS